MFVFFVKLITFAVQFLIINIIVVDHLSYKTKFVRTAKDKKEWFVIDATNQTVGRLCTRIASILRGKHKVTYTPNLDSGDFVIIINSDKVQFTGNKWNDKDYIHHTGYPGGQKIVFAKDLNKKNPIGVVENAVRGMLPKNSLGRAMFKKMFVYQAGEHPHNAQNPKTLTIN